jgi:hypothetical protein
MLNPHDLHAAIACRVPPILAIISMFSPCIILLFGEYAFGVYFCRFWLLPRKRWVLLPRKRCMLLRGKSYLPSSGHSMNVMVEVSVW